MIEDTPTSNFSSQSKYRHVIGIGKLETGVRPPHSLGGGGFEAAVTAANMPREAAAVDSSRCVGSGGRLR